MDARAIPTGDVPAWVLLGLAILVVVGVIYDTVAGRNEHAKFLRQLAAAPAGKVEAVRARFLRRWALTPWILTIVALIWVAVAPDIELRHLGITLPDFSGIGTIGTGFLGGALLGVLLAVVAVLIGMLVARRRGNAQAAGSGGAQADASSSTPPDHKPAVMVNRKVDPMLPTGTTDRRAWLLLSATAGITEEIIYRGLLLLTLTLLLPSAPTPLVWMIAAAIFGAAHLYQGWVGVLTTGILAVPLIFLYTSTGSLLLGMIVHFVLDARAAFVKRAPLADERTPREK